MREIPELSMYNVTSGLVALSATTSASEGSRIFRMVQGWRMRGIQSVIDLLVISRPCGLWASLRHPGSPGQRRVYCGHGDSVTTSRLPATAFV